MNRYQRLLFVVDNSCQRTAAFKRAQALAQTSRAALHLVMFDYVEARRLQPIATVINYCSRNEVDVLVVGRTEHHPLPWLGSFAEPLLAAPPCSILAPGPFFGPCCKHLHSITLGSSSADPNGHGLALLE
ncbi:MULTISPECIES: universal stress protein [Pseudomonas]|uniref:universal stress protein n=1 Tax=Pseudomonas TaxID=286 RepID=UPI00289655A5|nr:MULTISPECIES: universal stress protein [Pseudomonas]